MLSGRYSPSMKKPGRYLNLLLRMPRPTSVLAPIKSKVIPAGSGMGAIAAQSAIVTKNPQAVAINIVCMAFFPLDEEAELLLKLVSQNAQTSECTCSNQEQGDAGGFWHGYLPSPDWHCYQESTRRGD